MSGLLQNRCNKYLLELSRKEAFTQRAIEQFGDEWCDDIGDLLQH